MAGIDWKHADLDKREAFSFTANRVGRLCQKIVQTEDVAGCVLLSTCNRTELYINGASAVQPAQLLCQAAGVQHADTLCTTRRGEDAVRHLMRVSCGLCSQILGEDQIVSQVKRAYQIAHDAQSADAVLSQLFRIAVTAGKRSRTQVRLSAAPMSIAGKAVELIRGIFDEMRGKHALVIGNGEMGRLASSLLVSQGCDVTVTLRSYHHGQTIVPAGCHTVAYDARMSLVGACDILISATTSPHFTVSHRDIANLPHVPAVICDLSMPRDIEPSVRHLSGVTFFDMDSMGGRDIHINAEDYQIVKDIIGEEMAEFQRWRAYRAALPLMDELCELTAERVATGYDFAVLCDGEEEDVAEKMEAAARMAAEKTARLLLSGLQGEWSDGALETCRAAILRKAPQLHNRQCDRRTV